MTTVESTAEMVAQVYATMARNIETVRRRLSKPLTLADKVLLGHLDDEAMMKTWRLQSGGRDLMAMPRAAFVRAVMLNHWYHHRGQMLVYLRMHDVPLPSVYGPTADENPFAAAVAAAR